LTIDESLELFEITAVEKSDRGHCRRVDTWSFNNLNGDAMALVFEHILTDGLGDISYLIGDDAKGIGAVIDPRADVDEYIRLARKHKLAITHILHTHVHEDFVSGARELAARTGRAVIYSSAENAEPYGYECEPVKDGQQFELGSVVLTARHTPGHTPEHMALLLSEAARKGRPHAVFSGGSLLINAAGRTDLLGPDKARELTSAQYRTLYDFYLRLDDDVIIHPTHAHGSPCGASIGDRLSSTIGYERRFNPFLQCKSEAEFQKFALQNLPPKPRYYSRLKQTNTRGPEVLHNLPVIPALPPAEFRQAVDAERAVLVDTRHMLAFGGGHIEGALNIAAAPQLPVWAGWMLDPATPILLVLDNDTEVDTVLRYFVRTGFTRFAGYLTGGMTSWDNAGYPIASTPQVGAQKVHSHPGAFLLLDVRSPGEWEKGHIPGARHAFLPQLHEKSADLAKDTEIVVYCDSGYRASIGASLLARAGFSKVSNMPGSWQAWRHAGYPVEA
jgi:hydroxyacylglutathione hydrolase